MMYTPSTFYMKAAVFSEQILFQGFWYIASAGGGGE